MNLPAQIQRVWDLPTRLFHWALAALIAVQYATGEFHFLDMRWHFWFGYVTLALIAFRALWGIFGSQTSRFSDFLRGPQAVLRYIHSLSSPHPQTRAGHNALGGWSVIALLASVSVQAVSGLFASDDIDTDGPFAAQVSDATVKLMSRVHHWNENVLLILVCLHVAAVLLYLVVKHDDLITPMWSGRKRVTQTQSLRFANGWLAMALFALCAAMIAALVWWAG